MILVNNTVESWLLKYPALNFDIKCICGSILELKHPWVSKDLIGVSTDGCANCCRPGASRSIYKSDEKNREMLQKLIAFGRCADIETEVKT